MSETLFWLVWTIAFLITIDAMVFALAIDIELEFGNNKKKKSEKNEM